MEKPEKQLITFAASMFKGTKTKGATLETGGVKYDFKKELETFAGKRKTKELRVAFLGTGYDKDEQIKIPGLHDLLQYPKLEQVDIFELDTDASIEAAKMIDARKIRYSRIYIGDIVDVMWSTLAFGDYQDRPSEKTRSIGKKFIEKERQKANLHKILEPTPSVLCDNTSETQKAWKIETDLSPYPRRGDYDVFITTRSVAYPSRYFKPKYRDNILLWILSLIKNNGILIIDNETSWSTLQAGGTNILSSDKKTINIRGTKCQFEFGGKLVRIQRPGKRKSIGHLLNEGLELPEGFDEDLKKLSFHQQI